MNTTSVTVIIPARIGSSRLPNKPLADIRGKSTIQRVWEKAHQIKGVSNLVVSTDSILVEREVLKFGGKVVRTGGCRTGSDRVALTMWEYFHDSHPMEIVVNLQGDLPFVEPEVVEELIAELEKNPKLDMVTPAIRQTSLSELWASSDTVKAIKGKDGEARYFSRSPIPFGIDRLGYWYHHYGVYAWRNEPLQVFAHANSTSWEIAEGLEQLRAVEMGMKVKLIETIYEPGIEINTYKDLIAARLYCNSLEEGK